MSIRQTYADLYAKTKMLMSVGRFDAAEKLVASAIDENGPFANLYNLYGVVFHKQSKFTDALEHFSKALEINPQFIEAGLNLSVTYCDLGRYDDAKHIFGGVLARTPNAQKQPDLVLGRIANHHARCGSLYEQSGLLSEAMSEYKKALSLLDKMPDVRLALGKIHFHLGQHERALSEFQTIVSKHPEEMEASLWLGIAAWKLDRLEQALSSFTRAQTAASTRSLATSYLRILQKELRKQIKS